MNVKFVARVLSYSFGKGKLKVIGRNRKIWFEIVRPETERTYLGSQLVMLRRDHPGDLRSEVDRLPGRGYYDFDRVRIQSDLLWPLYEWLYPRDNLTFTPEMAEIIGDENLAAIWADLGSRRRNFGHLSVPKATGAKRLLHDLFDSRGFPINPPFDLEKHSPLFFSDSVFPRLKQFLRPRLHPTMRWSLRDRQTLKWDIRQETPDDC
jgi:hypothetical protein